MKHILVATDGSEGAGRAIDYAARWAKNVGADLLIVNVITSLPEKPLRNLPTRSMPGSTSSSNRSRSRP